MNLPRGFKLKGYTLKTAYKDTSLVELVFNKTLIK